MNKLLFVGFLLFLLNNTYSQSNNRYLYNISFDKRKVTIVWVDSLRNKLAKTCYKVNRGVFMYENKSVLIKNSIDTLPLELKESITSNYKSQNSPPPTLPVVYIAFILDSNGTILERGFQLESLDNYFNLQVFKTISLFSGKISPEKVDGKYFSTLRIFECNFFDLNLDMF